MMNWRNIAGWVSWCHWHTESYYFTSGCAYAVHVDWNKSCQRIDPLGTPVLITAVVCVCVCVCVHTCIHDPNGTPVLTKAVPCVYIRVYICTHMHVIGVDLLCMFKTIAHLWFSLVVVPNIYHFYTSSLLTPVLLRSFYISPVCFIKVYFVPFVVTPMNPRQAINDFSEEILLLTYSYRTRRLNTHGHK